MPAIVKAINQVFIVVGSLSLGGKGAPVGPQPASIVQRRAAQRKFRLRCVAARPENGLIITQARQRQCALD
jgi:hypothetical protein